MTEYVTKDQANKSDNYFWKLTKERIAAATAPIRQDMRKIAALAVTGAVIGSVGLLMAVRHRGGRG